MVRIKIQEGMDPKSVFDYVVKKYPQVKPGSIRRYIDDHQNSLPPGPQNMAAPGPVPGSVDNTDPSANDIPDAAAQKNNTANSGPVSIGELDLDLQPGALKKESIRLTEMYRNQDGPQEERIKLERLPWLITKIFKAVKKVGPLKKRLAKWNDDEAVKMVADDAQKAIQNRLHISSKYADVLDLGMSTGNLFLSLLLHVTDPENKPTPLQKEQDARIRKELETNPKTASIPAQLDEIAGGIAAIEQAKISS